jgi:hypothetical protein
MNRIHNFKKSLIKQCKSLRTHFLKAPAFKAMDFILIICIIVISVILLIAVSPTEKGEYVEIYQTNHLIATYPLNENKEIKLDIEGEIIIKIEDGSVSVVANTCDNKICLNTPPIGKTGQRIICAPKKILIIIKSNNSNIYITG